jgi:hypothetical protein
LGSKKDLRSYLSRQKDRSDAFRVGQSVQEIEADEIKLIEGKNAARRATARIKANRVNARASAGPKTTRGRALVARNGLRQALTLSINSVPTLSEEAEALAREIAGTDPQPEIQELARRIAEVQPNIFTPGLS